MVAIFSAVMSNRKNKPLKHYINEHNGVPLWVLVNYLTLGNISKMYSNLDDNIRLTIAKDFKLKIKRQYNKNVHITPQDIEAILHQAHMYRNVCAHEERLYDYKIQKSKSRSNIFSNYNKIYNKNFRASMNNSYLFDLLVSLSLFLNKNDYTNLIKKMDKIIDKYSNTFNTISINDFYKKMKLPSDIEIKELL